MLSSKPRGRVGTARGRGQAGTRRRRSALSHVAQREDVANGTDSGAAAVNPDVALPSQIAHGPVPGEQMFIVREKMMSLILSGTKTEEIRNKPYKAGRRLVGHDRYVRGVVLFGAAEELKTVEEFRGRPSRHH